MIEYGMILLVTLAAGIGLGLLIKGKMVAGKVRDAESEASRIVVNAKREAETKLKEATLEAKEKFYQARADFERESREKRQEIQNQERRLTQKEENVEKKIELFVGHDGDADDEVLRDVESALFRKQSGVLFELTHFDLGLV